MGNIYLLYYSNDAKIGSINFEIYEHPNSTI